MAHVQKLSAGSIGGLANHCERKTDKHSNKMIDVTRTHLNYALDSNDSPIKYFNQRIGEVRINQRRDDIKVAASWVITQPRDIHNEESRMFFETSHKFLEDKYGKQNVIWSRVHMDESTPHLHFCFIPVTPDKKHEGQEKLCAKDVLNRGALQKFHGELSAEMKRVFCRDIGIETGQTEKNLPLEKLKVKTSLEETVNALTGEITAKEKELTEINAKIKPTIDARQLAEELQDDAKKILFSRYEKMGVHIDAYKKVVSYLQTESGKDAKIAELSAKVNKNYDIAMKNGNERDSLKVELRQVRTDHEALRREHSTLKEEHKKDRAILDAIRQHAPQILEKAIEFIKAQVRVQEKGRGMSR